MKSITRACLGKELAFQQRLLILTAYLSHSIMNLDPGDDANIMKLQSKAQEFINNPMSFEERLSISVAAMVPIETSDHTELDDTMLYDVLIDVFDGMSGLSGRSTEWKDLVYKIS